MLKICEVCGKEFETKQGSTCCSNKCHQKRWRINNGIGIIRENRKCIICGTEFKPYREGHVCCSKKCSQKRNKEIQRKNYAEHEEQRKASEAMPESNHKAIADLTCEAWDKERLSYGQYEAKRYMEKMGYKHGNNNFSR